MEPLEIFLKFVRERENIRIKKEAGVPPPWTDDDILRKYRFCNVRREDDKVTRWIAKNWRDPNKDDPDVWFAMAVARHVNLPDTLAIMGYPVPWKPQRFLRAIRNRKTIKLTAYNAAYMIRASSGPDWSDKAEYLSKAVLGPLWKHRNKLRPVKSDTLEAFCTRLQGEFGVAGFMAGQITADTKYVGPLADPLFGASDWWEFAVSGPGSKRGLNRILGRDPKAPWKEQDWREELAKFRVVLKPRFANMGLEWVHAQDCQSLLCEYSKYMKAYTGEGRPKQRYVPRGLPSVTPFQRLLEIRIGGNTERCHGIRHQGSYSVAAHSWGVAVLMFVLWPEDFPRLVPYCIMHDVPEAWVGDIPAPVKKYSPEVKAGAERMERQIFERLQLPNDADLAPLDKRKFRACDILELYLWAKEQVMEGNQHADCVRREVEGFIERDDVLLPEAHELFLQIKEGHVEYATDRLIRELNGVA